MDFVDSVEKDVNRMSSAVGGVPGGQGMLAELITTRGGRAAVPGSDDRSATLCWEAAWIWKG